MHLVDPKSSHAHQGQINKRRGLGGTHSKSTRDRVKTYVDLVLEICRIADAHKWTALVDIVLPSIQLFIALEGEEHPPVFRFQE